MQALSGSSLQNCLCGQKVNTSRWAFSRARPRTVTRAEDRPQTQTDESENAPPSSNGADKKKGPRLSFAPNTRSGMGYTDDDSAGQTNIFAVEPRLYLAGSDRDVVTSPGANIAIVTAAALAIAGIASGLIINFNNKEPRVAIEDEPGQYLTLSQYKDKFSVSTSPAPSTS